jgi:hypothetical protein
MDTKALRREIVNRSALCQSFYRVVIEATVGGLPWIDFSSGAAFGMAANKDSASVTSSAVNRVPANRLRHPHRQQTIRKHSNTARDDILAAAWRAQLA